MRYNVRFRYWAETADEEHTVELTVRAEVNPGAPAVTDRRPELCHEGEPADLVELEVLDENLEPLTEEQADARFKRGTWQGIVREVLESPVEFLDR